ncbi:hypothetical protein [Streptomyces sp. 2A115]|uniref:hypothetical protein n=1 Tax=Streptomyces sp. 2A115 TaxID=3457439 RepID=UPI003FD50DDC
MSDARYVERIGQIPESLSKGEWVSWTLDCTNCLQRFWLGGQLGRGARWNYESEDDRARRDSPPAPPAPPEPSESPEPRKRRWGRG